MTTIRRALPTVLFGLALLACGCGPATPPASYAVFEASTGQWVIKVTGIAPAQTEKIRAAVEPVANVEKGSILVSPTGEYVAFRTTVSTRNGGAHGEVKDAVIKKLNELGLTVGESKTRLW